MVIQSVKINRAAEKDAELICHLSTKTFVDTFRGTCSDDDMKEFVEQAFSLKEIINELRDKNDFYFIAYYNDEAAGYMRLKEDYSDYPAITRYNALELKRIYVLEKYHSKKVGAALMQFALQFTQEKNYEAIWLGVWEHNERAKTFYKKWGFIDTGKTHNFPIGNTPQIDNWLIKFIVKN